MTDSTNGHRTASTSEVAKALAIREDTIRRLARNGEIPFDDAPGGRRRFNVDEVKAALDEASHNIPMRNHSLHHFWFVDATELDGWAERRDSQQDFPLAIRILIAASTQDIREIEFRTGEGVNFGGWDGRVLTEAGTAWVPAGASGWELGTDEDILRKANSDYDARSADPLGIDPSVSTFVFATPRRWPGRDRWVETKRAEGKWADVRAYDADSMEAWLDQNPAAHARITRLVGRDPDGASDVRTAWERWAQRSAPALPPALLTAGRDEQAQRLLRSLSDEPSSISVVAESVEEALAFTLASLNQASEEQVATVDGKGLVVATLDAWKEALRRARSNLILIPTFAEAPTADALQAGHHVITPADKNTVTRGETLELGRLRTAPAKEALLAVGVKERRAEKLAVLARRSLIMARRQMSADAGIARPEWAKPEAAGTVVAALFAGGWRDDRDGDKQVLSGLSGSSYDEFTSTLNAWVVQPDPPVRRTGLLWFITSKEDAWELTSRFVTSAQLDGLKEAAIAVLSEVDPSLELDASQRWTASIYGKVRNWSDSLRAGLAETLAVIASRSGDVVLANGMTGQVFADLVVREVLSTANKDASGSMWNSLHSVLHPLAEASPTQFLAGVEEGLANGTVAKLFDPEAESSGIFGRASHTDLLWALECLAWSPDYLPAAAAVLAQLAAIDPGGNWSNRPSASLREIFLPWLPHTTMPLDDRLAVLKSLRRIEPTIGWSLAVDLLPSSHDMSHETSKPKWREWAPEERSGVTVAEYHRTVNSLMQDLTEEAGDSPERWGDLVEKLGNVQPEQHDAIVAGLGRIDPKTLTEPELHRLTARLRAVVQRHESYPTADWALPAERVAILRAELERLEEPNLVIASVWLFKHDSLFVYERDPISDRALRDGEAKLAEAQLAAVRNVLNVAGLDSLLHLAELAETPWSIGFALAAISEVNEDDLIQKLDSDSPAHRSVASGFVQARYRANGWDWSNRHLALANDWPLARIAAYLLAHYVEATTLDSVDSFSEEVRRLYWSSVAPYGVAEDISVRVVNSLLEFGRPGATLMIIHSNPKAFDSGEGVDLTVRALTDTARAPGDESPAMLKYYIEQLLARLIGLPDFERSRLAQLEWLYLPLFEHGDRRPVILHEELQRNPQFFAEVVSWIYRAEGEPPQADQSDETRARARLGYSLLHTWRTPPPAIEQDDIPSLADWVSNARRFCADLGRGKIGDQCVGHLLRYAEPETDGTWPNKAVCEIIEECRSPELEAGLEVEVFNSRGVISRDPYSGGALERALVGQYREYAERLSLEYPRTRNMLTRIADSWTSHALREDMESELREDLAD